MRPTVFRQVIYAISCVACLAAPLFLATAGCSRFRESGRLTYETLPDRPQQKAELAKKHNTQGLEALAAGELDKAEKLFGEALAIDVNYGPAHNNLGQIYLKRHQLYLAAWEFEFAANLMPDKNQSLLNLGLVYETAGELEQARDHYERALVVNPQDANTLGNLARINVKLDAEPVRINWLLRQLVMYESRPAWLGWAKGLLATKYRIESSEGLPVEVMGPTTVVPEAPVEYGVPSMIEHLPTPAPAPQEETDTFFMGDVVPLDLSSLPRPQLPNDLPRVPQTYVQPASFSENPR